MEQKDPPPEKCVARGRDGCGALWRPRLASPPQLLRRRYSIEWYLLEAEKSRNRPAKQEEPVAPALLALTGLLGGTAVLLAMR